MYVTSKKISFVICAYNEEKAIAQVLKRIPKDLTKKLEVIVVDNNSRDKTSEIARKYATKVIEEKKQGKGHALRTGLKNVSKNTDYVVMIDADNTYSPEETGRLIELLDSDFCDFVVGSRLQGNITGKSLTTLNRIGNWIFTFLVRVFYHSNATDLCTGFMAWKKKVADDIAKETTSPRFTIETEMVCKMARKGYRINSAPITYSERIGKSSLNPFTDGIKILIEIFRNLR